LHGRSRNLGGPALALAASLALLLALAAGCGDDGSAELASAAPPDAPFYAEFALRPEGEQTEAIERFTERVAGIDDPGGAIVAELDDSLADEGVDATYEDDIEPWLGDRGALFVRSFESLDEVAMTPEVAVMIQVTDADAAQEFIDRAAAADSEDGVEERTYGEFDYVLAGEGTAVGLIDDSLLALGPEDAFKVAVDAFEGESLAESEDYGLRTDALGDDLLGFAYLEPGAAIEAAIASEDLDPRSARLLKPLLGGPLSDPLAIGLSATAQTASLDFVSRVDGQEDIATEAALIEGLPAGSWLAVGVPDLGAALEQTLDQLANSGLPGAGSIRKEIRAATGFDLRADSLDWLGDASAFVEGTSVPGFTAGLIGEIDDPEGPRELLERVRAFVERDSGLRSAAPPEGADYGFSLGLPSLGGGAEAGVLGDRLVGVLGGTVARALEPESELGSEPGYEAAVESLGEDVPPGLYVHLPSFFEVAEQGGSAADPDYRAAKPYLDAFESLAAGTTIDDELALTRVTVSLAE
jgi:Protein of unknown function (DUF3352)